MNAPVRQIIFGNRPPVNPALRLLWNTTTRTMEPAGMAADFTTPYGDVAVIDPTTPANQVVTDRSWFTQSGTSPKMVRDASGTYVWAAHNMVLQSAPASAWSADNGTITFSVGGSLATFTENTATGVHGTYQSATPANAVAGMPYTYRVRLAAGTRRYVQVSMFSSAQAAWATVDTTLWTITQTGVAGATTYISSSIAAVGDGSYDVTLTAIAGAAVAAYVSTVGATTGTGGATRESYLGTSATWYFGRVQLNRDYSATAYVPTTSAAVYTLAQDYDPTLGWALLVEPAATNLALQARDLSNASWTKTSVTATKDVAGIDGVSASASKLVATAANGTVRQNVTSASAARITSIFARRRVGTGAIYVSQGGTTGSDIAVNGAFAADTDWTKGAGWAIAAGVAAAVAATSDLSETIVTLTAGKLYQIVYTVTAFTGGTVQAIVGGTAGTARGSAATFTEVIKCGATTTLAFTAAAFTGSIDNVTVYEVSETSLTLTTSYQRFSTASATITDPPLIIRMATSGDEIDVDVVQHEAAGATVATSPIPTAAATVTRAADDVEKVITAFPYNAVESTVYISAVILDTSVGQDLFTLDAGLAESLAVYRNSSATSTVIGWARDGGVTQATANNGILYGTDLKVAAAFKLNDFAISVNGGAVGTDTAGTMPTVTKLRLATGIVVSANRHLRIRSIVYLPRRMTNAELVARSAQ